MSVETYIHRTPSPAPSQRVCASYHLVLSARRRDEVVHRGDGVVECGERQAEAAEGTRQHRVREAHRPVLHGQDVHGGRKHWGCGDRDVRDVWV